MSNICTIINDICHGCSNMNLEGNCEFLKPKCKVCELHEDERMDIWYEVTENQYILYGINEYSIREEEHEEILREYYPKIKGIKYCPFCGRKL